MTTKNKINALIQNIDLDTGIEPNVKSRKKALVSNLVESTCKYVDIVVKQGYLLQVNKGTIDRDTLQELASLDKTRTTIHNSLIAQISIINRLYNEYNLEPIYQGGDERREKGDFALELVSDYFKDRL